MEDKHAAYVTTFGCAPQRDYVGFSFGGELNDATGVVELSVTSAGVAEGETLSVTVTNPDETVVTQHSGVVAYYSFEPNGPGCNPTCTAGRY